MEGGTRALMTWARRSGLNLFMRTLYCLLHYYQAPLLTLCCEMQYSLNMTKPQVVQIRVSKEEKQGFAAAADLAGIPLSAWVRERLRLAAIRDLEAAGQRIPFVKPIHLGEEDG